MATTFIVTSPNPRFGGKTCGVQFNEGRAIVNQAILPKGRKVKQVIEELTKPVETGGFGYKAKPVDGGKDEAEAVAANHSKV